MRSEQELNIVIDKYSDTVRRICMVYLKNHADTEDVFQNVFMKYMLNNKEFESEEHEKAWVIRVTINACKDMLRSFFRCKTVPLDEVFGMAEDIGADNRDVIEAVISLPAKYKEVVYLHYYEGYTAPQMSEILGKNVNTIYTLLTRSKKLLKEKLGDREYA